MSSITEGLKGNKSHTMSASLLHPSGISNVTTHQTEATLKISYHTKMLNPISKILMYYLT